MSSGSGQDAAGWTTNTFCEFIPCTWEGDVDVEYRDGDAGWTCPECGRRNPATVREGDE